MKQKLAIIALMLLASCSKETTQVQPKITVIGNVSQQEVDKFSGELSRSLEMEQVSAVSLRSHHVSSTTLSTMVENMPPDEICSGCSDGYYLIPKLASGGMFSNFQATFMISNGVVSNFNLILNGLSFGTTWQNVGTYYNPDQSSGTSIGTALYEVGMGKLSVTYAIKWVVEKAPGTGVIIRTKWSVPK